MKTSSPDKYQVAITGIGMITPVGLSAQETWNNMIQGHSGIARIDQFDASQCLTQIGGQLPPGYAELEKKLLQKDHFARAPKAARLAVLTVDEALKDASLPCSQWQEKAGLITGCGSALGDVSGKEQLHWFYHEMSSSLPAIVSACFDLRGPAFNVATACSSGGFAIALCCEYVLKNQATCIALGLDTLLHKDTIDGFNSIMALSELNEAPERASRPFDMNRSGFVLSEGAGALVLEPLAEAEQRNANIYALLTGYSLTSEAYNIVAPDPEGDAMARTMQKAILGSRLKPSDIGYISAHGTSTIHNDIAETKAIKKVFGNQARQIPVSAQKSMIGHPIGAAAAIECVITALTLKNQIITPTINLEKPDQLCDLDYVPGISRRVSGVRAALSNSFGFGGHNSSLVLESYK